MTSYILMVVLLFAWSQQVLSQDGINALAVPSLDLLGTAKGGTTDIFHMIETLHSGFPLDTEKELELLNTPKPISPERVRCYVMCPAVDKECRRIRGVDSRETCAEWMRSRNHSYNPDFYSFAAGPMQFFSDPAGRARFFKSLNEASGAKTLFLLTLRDPVTAIPSLYNHWLQQQGPSSVDATLEAGLNKEFSTFEQTENQVILNELSASIKNGTIEFKRIFSLFEKLPGFAHHHNFLKTHMYTALIMGYLAVMPNVLKENLIIVRSEYLFADRFKFFYEDMVPFMHPPNTRVHQSYTIVPRSDAESKLTKIQNQKPTKRPEASLSPVMLNKLRKFFDLFPVEPLLFHLQDSRFARVVPPLTSSSFEGGTWKWG